MAIYKSALFLVNFAVPKSIIILKTLNRGRNQDFDDKKKEIKNHVCWNFENGKILIDFKNVLCKNKVDNVESVS